MSRPNITSPITFDQTTPLLRLLREPRTPLRVLVHTSGRDFALDAAEGEEPDRNEWRQIGLLPPLYPEWLGDQAFAAAHGTRFAYVGGEMARGIATVAMVTALAECGALGFFGAAGLPLNQVETALTRLSAALDPRALPWGVNLIHSPDAPGLEEALTDLLLAHGVRRASASAFMTLAPCLVRYSATGLRRQADGSIVRRNHLFAKVSRPEVARHFLSPPPAALLETLVAAGQLSRGEADLAALLPVAGDVTVEADSGGHTDNRPLGAVFPAIASLRSDLVVRHGFAAPPRLGAAGGLGTPASLASAFALGAAYVLVGSVHQSCTESGLAPDARAMLATASLADVAMTAAGDMFEQGVKVQVLKRGTLMAARGNRLYQLFRQYGSVDALPADLRAEIETEIFQAPLETIWLQVRSYLAESGRGDQADAAEGDPRAKFARLCKWYLGRSSRWPIEGNAARRADYQIWCGPAMGAFNAWVRGSFLEPVAGRSVTQVALNLLEGAAVLTRAHQVRSCGFPLPAAAFEHTPEPLAVEPGGG